MRPESPGTRLGRSFARMNTISTISNWIFGGEIRILGPGYLLCCLSLGRFIFSPPSTQAEFFVMIPRPAVSVNRPFQLALGLVAAARQGWRQIPAWSKALAHQREQAQTARQRGELDPVLSPISVPLSLALLWFRASHFQKRDPGRPGGLAQPELCAILRASFGAAPDSQVSS